MKKIMFVCYGNICRSPLAEFVFRDIVKKAGKEKDYYIESSATSTEELGNPVYRHTAKILDRLGIDYSNKRAQKLTMKDYDNYDLFIGMDKNNLRDMNSILGGDKEGKIKLLLSFAGREEDVADHWWTRDFEKSYQDILEGCSALFNQLTK